MAVTRIQKYARGGITRERVKKIRLARWHGLQEGIQGIQEESDGDQIKELKIFRNIKGV